MHFPGECGENDQARGPKKRFWGGETSPLHGKAEKSPHHREKKQGFGSWGLREPWH